jgi:Spy/CpxP family protein refolding chaperone
VDAAPVTVSLVDASSAPVVNADVAVEISQPTISGQLSQYSVRLGAVNQGGGQYQSSVVSPQAGDFRVLVKDRASLAAATSVLSCVLLTPAKEPAPVKPVPDAKDAKNNCKQYFARLDFEFFPPEVGKRTDITAAEIATRNANLKKIMEALEELMKDPTYDASAVKDLVKQVSASLAAIAKEFFGDPIDPAKFQACTELFNNFALVDFDAAIKNIKDEETVVRGPDSAIAHLRWATFAALAIQFGFDPDFWDLTRPILGKGSAITVAALDKTKPHKLTEAEIAALRKIYDALKPAKGDTPEVLKKKRADLDKLIQDLIKIANDPSKVIGMLPGVDSNTRLVTSLASATCSNGSEPFLAAQTQHPISFNDDGSGNLFGFGTDSRGLTYVLQGSTLSGQSQFAVSGFGLAPALAQGVAIYRASSSGPNLSGTVQGVVSGTFGGQPDTCTWSGTFQLQPRSLCDIDGNGVVDQNDLNLISPASQGTHAAVGDPRDSNGDGIINSSDVGFCASQCTNSGCIQTHIDRLSLQKQPGKPALGRKAPGLR